MLFKSSSLGVLTTGNNKYRFFLDGDHIRAEDRRHCAVAIFVARHAKTGVQVGSVTFGQDAGIKLRFISRTFSQTCAVPVANVTEKLISACRRIAYSHGNNADFIQHIIQVIAAVRSPGHVRRVQAHAAVRVHGIGCPGIDDPFTAPIAQIIDRRGPPHVVAHAKHKSIVHVVRTIHVYAVAEDIGLPVGDILPGGKVGVHCLMLHRLLLPE
ncbi:hypothetical protein SDC9_150237 [bioreactor metagenome]|uniref:Uncharacterized protein n=1 Tax=bioreactor metagenome TaxID=1076179 RepID=A0A645EQY9_9ZZZZ